MNYHLNPEELADATLGLLEPERASHLQECVECRTRTDGYRAPLEQWRDDARVAAVQPDSFWARQRAVISVRLHERSFDRGIRFVWAGAVAALVLAAALSWSPATKTPATPQTSEAQDEQLLENMQAALERESPLALQPAEVLTKEMSRARNVSTRSRQGAVK
jgi:anti-sigma factor RsiW